MESLIFHPKVVHLPIALGVLMPLIAASLALAWWRSFLPKRAWLVAVALQTMLVLSGFVAMRTGEAEEGKVEPIVGESVLEAHEEAAEAFVWTSAAVLLLFVGAAILRREGASLALAVAATIGTLVVFGLGYRTGEAGGSLVYEHGAASAYTSPGEGSPAPAYRGDHEDHD
ncbi:MAG: hypothetical protein Q9Q40_15410 [Acidobacteriota bacterium]|nr:hypothetical protein [Acidobacteriota bacterium]MDQ7087287.1 hypothetical protein [Acidobacteriota bacterium]